MRDQGHKYDAFISYSHAADQNLAPAIQKALHNLAKPWYKLRALDVYRDQTNLSISPELWPDIQKAISVSNYFLLFASSAAARSKWVKREVTWWIGNRPVKRLLLILTEGDLVWDDSKNDFDWSRTTALPDSLAGKFSYEPNYIDFRSFKSEKPLTLRDPAFLDNILSIAAPLHKKTKEELGGEDVRQHRITKIISWTAGLVIGAISVIAVWQAIVASRERTVAVRQGSIALARQLAAQSELIRANDFRSLPLSAALATEALNIYATVETDHAAWNGLVLLPELNFETGNWGVAQAKFSPDGKYFATAGTDDSVRVFEFSTKRIIYVIANGAPVWDIDFSKDDSCIATAGADGVVNIVNYRSERLLTTYKHLAAVRKVLFSPDQRYVASASEDKTACIWDIEKREKRSTIIHHGTVWSLSFSHSGNYLATAGRDSVLILWDIETNKLKHRLLHKDILWNVSFSMDDQYLLSTCDDRFATIWQTSDGKLVKRLEHSGRVMAAAFSPDGKKLVTTGWDQTIKLWSIPGFGQLSTINTDGIILSLAYSPDGQYFVTGGSNTRIWSAVTYREVNRLYKEKEVYNVAFSPDGVYVATADAEKARVWKLVDHTRNSVETQDRITDAAEPIITGGWSAVMSADNSLLVTANEDGSARLWDLETHKIKSFFRHGRPINAVAYAHAGKLVATASENLVKLWNVTSGMEMSSYQPGGEVVSLDFDNTGNYLAIGGSFGVKVLETSSGKPVFTQTTRDPVHFTAFDQSSGSLLTIDAGGRVNLFDLKAKRLYFDRTYNNLMGVSIDLKKNVVCLAGENTVTLLGISPGQPAEKVMQVNKGLSASVSPDKQFVAICRSADSTVRIFNIDTKKEIAAYKQGAAAMTSAFDSKCGHLAVGCHDGSIHIFDLKTSSEVSSITWNADDPIDRIRFSPDGRFIVAASQKYRTGAWLWRDADAIHIACGLLDYQLSETDWDTYMNGRPYQPVCK